MSLSAKGARRIGQVALREIYQRLLRDRAGGHGTDRRGAIEVRPYETRPYVYGDVMALDLVATLKRGLARRLGTPLSLHPDDFEVHAAEHATTTSTVLLLDMSWSMSWEGRFAARSGLWRSVARANTLPARLLWIVGSIRVPSRSSRSDYRRRVGGDPSPICRRLRLVLLARHRHAIGI
jgi:hypothetical protein